MRALGVLEEGIVLRLAEKLERFIYRRASLITAVTDGIASTLISDKEVSRDKILFLPNGVDTDLFRPRPPDPSVRERFGIDDRQIVLYAGTMGYAHSTEAILDAAELLRERHVVFVLAGDGSERARVEHLAHARGLSNVMFLGVVPLSAVADLYSAALAGLATLRDLPLFEGARPAKVMPCLASGTPLVYSGSGEGARLVSEADAGIVVDPEDGAAIAGAVERLLDDPGLVRAARRERAPTRRGALQLARARRRLARAGGRRAAPRPPAPARGSR